mgnify:FL=1
MRRVRFAPSPTGPLHIGGLRTALFNYLFAKKTGGSFILRIEDTDKKREVSGAEKYIIDALNWCGIFPDERPGTKSSFGPYRQSERNHIYSEEIKKLIDSGHAYYAFDSEEDLASCRSECEKRGETFIYNYESRLALKNSLSMSKDDVADLLKKGEGYVVRFLVPKNKNIKTVDVIRGESNINSSLLDDKVLMKADGTPTYHFANVVDDHLMKITHVIRGEEWLPSLALHFLLYEAFGWKRPSFAHLPLILNPNGKGKLSKRSGEKGGFPVFPIRWEGEAKLTGFKEYGILPSGLVNYLTTLGWSPKEGSEALSLDELTDMFQLKNVVSAGANFDLEKLLWYNHKHIQGASDEVLVDKLQTLDVSAKKTERKRLIEATGMVKERANTVSELWGLMEYLFLDPKEYDEKSLRKIKKDGLDKICSEIISLCESTEVPGGFVDSLKIWGEKNGIGAGQIMMTTRTILVGGLNGIDLQKIVSFVGLEVVSKRTVAFSKMNI